MNLIIVETNESSDENSDEAFKKTLSFLRIGNTENSFVFGKLPRSETFCCHEARSAGLSVYQIVSPIMAKLPCGHPTLDSWIMQNHRHEDVHPGKKKCR